MILIDQNSDIKRLHFILTLSIKKFNWWFSTQVVKSGKLHLLFVYLEFYSIFYYFILLPYRIFIYSVTFIYF